MKEELNQIYLNLEVDKIVPFLQKLTPKDKKELIPLLNFYSNSSHRKGEDAIFLATAFVCSSQAQFRDFTQWQHPNKEATYILNDVLEWYCPKWFSDFVNAEYDGHPSFPYDQLVDWNSKGYIRATPETIVKALIETVDQLEINPITLEKHFWYIFEYETTINWTDVYRHNYWANTIVSLVDDGKLERIRTLKECLHASNRGFNKNLTGWFTDLFNYLKPTDEELFNLQSDIISSLMCPHSKIVNSSLNIIKRLCNDERFEAKLFIENIPILASSTVKSVLNSTLSIIDKITKKNKNLSKDISLQLINIFITKDESIQDKAAKYLAKYSDATDEDIKAAILPYKDMMFSSVREKLKAYFDETNVEQDEEETTSDTASIEPLINENNKINRLNTTEDFGFFAAQTFSNFQPIHFDLLTAETIRFANQVDESTINQLEPVIQQIYKKIYFTRGYYRVLAAFFLSYSDLLIESKPEITKKLQAIRENNKQITLRIENWAAGKELIFVPFVNIMRFALDFIRKGINLPLLSTPTHEPSWIDPVTLVDRLQQYKTANVEVNEMDLQLALQRCAISDTKEASALAENTLEGEYKYLILFLLSGDIAYKSKTTIEKPHLWLTAALSTSNKELYKEFLEDGSLYSTMYIPKAFFRGNYGWNLEVKVQKERVWVKNKYEDVIVHTPEIVCKRPSHTLGQSNKKLFSEYLFAMWQYWFDTNDMEILINTFPNNIEPLLHYGLCPCSSYVYDIKEKLVLLKGILESNREWGEFTYLLLGSYCLLSDKEIRLMTSEIWIAHTPRGYIDQKKWGEIIGQLINFEWGPAKRFTDMVINNLLNISHVHNKALEELFAAIIFQIRKPVTNLKKVLGLYNELLSLNNSKPDDELMLLLKNWEQENSLKKVVKQIMEK